MLTLLTKWRWRYAERSPEQAPVMSLYSWPISNSHQIIDAVNSLKSTIDVYSAYNNEKTCLNFGIFYSVIKNRRSNIASQWNNDKVFNIISHYTAVKQIFIVVNATEIDYDRNLWQELLRIKAIIIDEISTVLADMLSFISDLFAKLHNKPIGSGGVPDLLIGDLFQLPLVKALKVLRFFFFTCVKKILPIVFIIFKKPTKWFTLLLFITKY